MSKKHFDQYFDSVFEQYSEMLDVLHEMEELCTNNIVSPEKLDQITKSIEPIKNNYMTLSYVRYLLNKPQNDKKEKRYIDQNKKMLRTLDVKRSPSGVKAENSQVIENLKEAVHEVDVS